MRRQVAGSAGSLETARWAYGHRVAGLMALLPTGMTADPGLVDGARTGRARKEMVVMMFWNGGSWPFWEVALMWVGMIAFWALLI